MTSRPVIFISAVSNELHSARELVAKTLHFLGYDADWQGVFDAGQGDLRGSHCRRIEASAGVVQIVGQCYGCEPTKPDDAFGRVSYTQFEALYARQRGKKVWYLLLDDTFPADAHEPEPGELTALQSAYREQVRTGDHLWHRVADTRGVEITVLRFRDELTHLRRRGRQVVLAILLLLALCAGGVAWLMKSGGQTKVQLDDTQKQLKAMREEMAALSKGVMEFAGTKSRIQKDGGKQTEAEMDEKTYAALAKELGIAEKVLREKLPPFARQLAQSPTAAPFERANAAYVAKDYAEAERLALQAADEAKAASLPRNADAIAAYRLAGQSARQRVQYAAARKYFESAAALTEKNRDLIEWADVQIELAWLLYLDGKYREQETLAHAVWDACRAAGKGEEPIGMAARGEWASALDNNGKSQQAEAEYREIVRIEEGVLGAEHPATLASRSNLASALRSQGKYAEAEQQHRVVLAIRERVLGAEHPTTLLSRMRLAIALQSQGKNVEAEQEYRAVLKIQERVLGAEHPDSLMTRMNLALALGSQGKNAEAEQQYRAGLKIQERVLGAEHPHVFQGCYNLALCLEAQAKLKEALEFMQRAETGWQKVLGVDHPDTKDATKAREHIEAALAKENADKNQNK